MSVFTSIDDVQDKLSEQGYVCSRALATVVFLSLKLGRPLFLEGEAGVGKTEIAKGNGTSSGFNSSADLDPVLILALDRLITSAQK